MGHWEHRRHQAPAGLHPGFPIVLKWAPASEVMPAFHEVVGAEGDDEAYILELILQQTAKGVGEITSRTEDPKVINVDIYCNRGVVWRYPSSAHLNVV